MKRKIGALIIILVEALFISLRCIPFLFNAIKDVTIGIKVSEIFSFFINFLKLLDSFITWNFYQSILPVVRYSIILFLLNVIFFILYFVIFGLISLLQRKITSRDLRLSGRSVYLSEEEKAKYDYNLYLKKFPVRRLISEIIPLGIIALFILFRFDVHNCVNDAYNEGFIHWMDNMPWVKDNMNWLYVAIEVSTSGYIAFINLLQNTLKFAYVEWIIVGLGTIIIATLWFLLFSIGAKKFAIKHAKNKAIKAKNRYIQKMEKTEHDSLAKAKKETVKKINHQENIKLADNSSLKAISKTYNEAPKSEDEIKKDEYIEDISSDVTDLGVLEDNDDEIQEAFVTREEEKEDAVVDIRLDHEPVIETLEEEEFDFNDEEAEEETFERYDANFTPDYEIEDKIKKYNIEAIDENGKDQENTSEILPVIKDFEDKSLNGPSEITLFDVDNLETNKEEIVEDNKKAIEEEPVSLVDENLLEPEIIDETIVDEVSEEPVKQEVVENPVESEPVKATKPSTRKPRLALKDIPKGKTSLVHSDFQKD